MKVPSPIKLLSEEIKNHIAAGEVIERPYCVVKELVENSIDAEAKNIVVEVEEGGKKLIRVIDDGIGILKDDLLKAVLRHATSKIEKVEDLFAINTLGFRGEALASIASISQFVLQSRPEIYNIGYKIKVKGGEIVTPEPEPTSMNRGSIVEVSNLFFNLPARKKFLKSEKSELASIKEKMFAFALAYYDKRIVLKSNGKVILNVLEASSRKERILDLFGDIKLLYGTSYSDSTTVELWISRPEESSISSSGFYFIVNGRVVKDKTLYKIVTENCRFKVGFPRGVLFIDTDPSLVDVNVHPQKSEVRFNNPKEIFLNLHKAISGAMEGLTQSSMIGVFVTKDREESIKTKEELRIKEVIRNYEMKYLRGEDRDDTRVVRWDFVSQKEGGHKEDRGEDKKLYSLPFEASERRFSEFKYIGQHLGTFLIFSQGEDLIIIDQHAAHERITYESLKESILRGKVEAQKLLLPVIVHIENEIIELFEIHKSAFEKLGLEFDRFGENELRVTMVPTLVSPSRDEIVKMIQEIGEKVATYNPNLEDHRTIDELIATMACHSSIRGGEEITEREANSLVEMLAKCKNREFCPHGRPILFVLTKKELYKRFNRGK